MKNLHLSQEDPTPDFTLHIGNILSRVDCPKHKAIEGAACYYLHSDHHPSGFHIAICNSRAVRAGYNGRVSDKALRRNRPKKPQPKVAQKAA